MLFEKIHLEEDEKIIKIVHKHWFILFTRSVGIILTGMLPIVTWFFISTSNSSLEVMNLDLDKYISHFVFFYSLWLLLCWMSLAYIWTDYYLDIWAVTDRRIILIEQVTLFRRNIGSFRLEKLQDMNIEINGIIATLLHYGTVEAQTASASDEEFREDFIPHPRELKAIIMEAADKRMTIQNNYNKQDI